MMKVEANEKEKQIAFYMAQRSSKELDEIQPRFAEHVGHVTKAYILNQTIYKYYEYVRDYYGISETVDKNENE